MKAERPNISDFFPKGITIQEVHTTYKNSPVLWKYIQALDAYADELESKLSTLEVTDEEIIPTDSRQLRGLVSDLSQDISNEWSKNTPEEEKRAIKYAITKTFEWLRTRITK